MITAQVKDIAEFIGAKFIGDDVSVSQVFTDSRNTVKDGLFVALRGPHFDAHNFLAQVVELGAKALVVEEASILPVAQIIVKDTRKALGDIAKFNRAALSAEFVAITGSSGKTTVKEMLASILRIAGKTYATLGNFNNEIGVPLTLLAMDQSYNYGVIEMGANHAGEIDYTASITQPKVALINNVAAAHLEGFGDLQGVARAKGEIYQCLQNSATAIINNDDYYASFWKKKLHSKMLTFSTQHSADVRAHNIYLDDNHCANFELEYAQQRCQIQLSLAGVHNVNNALAAASCAIALNIDLAVISQGLKQTPIVAGRLVSLLMSNGCNLIDDTYNANLESMRAAIHLLAGYSGLRILVIGDMAELGEFGRDCHEQIGEIASQAGIEQLFTCGVLSKYAQNTFSGQGKHFKNQQELIQQLKQEATTNVTILVKGSRSAHMDKVVNALKEYSGISDPRIVSNEGDK